jgi:hypothetical protein
MLEIMLEFQLLQSRQKLKQSLAYWSAFPKRSFCSGVICEDKNLGALELLLYHNPLQCFHQVI